MSLYIYVIDPVLREKYREHVKSRRSTDSGMDILSPEWKFDGTSERFGREMKLGIHCAATTVDGTPAPYMLLARSSMSLTSLRLANQIGLADMGYRGELLARVDITEDYAPRADVTFGQRIFQIVQHNWLPWKEVILVDSLDQLPAAPDNRGSGGFGSTGK